MIISFGSVQDCGISSALTMEILQTKFELSVCVSNRDFMYNLKLN